MGLDGGILAVTNWSKPVRQDCSIQESKAPVGQTLVRRMEDDEHFFSSFYWYLSTVQSTLVLKQSLQKVLKHPHARSVSFTDTCTKFFIYHIENSAFQKYHLGYAFLLH